MAPGIYNVSFVSGFTGQHLTHVVKVDEQGLHYCKSEITGMFNKTVPYGNEAMGFTWRRIE